MTKNNLDELEMRGVDIGYTSTASSSHADISHDALLAAYDLVEKMVGFANDFKGAAPLWHGWALREAFLAGALYEQNKQKTASTQKNV